MMTKTQKPSTIKNKISVKLPWINAKNLTTKEFTKLMLVLAGFVLAIALSLFLVFSFGFSYEKDGLNIDAKPGLELKGTSLKTKK